MVPTSIVTMGSSLAEPRPGPGGHWLDIRDPSLWKGSQNDQVAKVHTHVSHSRGGIAREALAPLVPSDQNGGCSWFFRFPVGFLYYGRDFRFVEEPNNPGQIQARPDPDRGPGPRSNALLRRIWPGLRAKKPPAARVPRAVMLGGIALRMCEYRGCGM